MKKTQRRELWRTIKAAPMLFIAIVMVTALGIAAYCSLSFTDSGITKMGEEYYEQTNFYDVKLVSPLGFSKTDVDMLKNVEGVIDAYAGYTADSLISINGENIVTEFFTQSNTINIPDIKEGRLPKEKNECMIEQPLAKEYGIKIGDEISLTNPSEHLKSSSFTVVGIAELPLVLCQGDFYNRGVSSIGAGQIYTYIVLDDNAFQTNTYMDKPLCYLTTNSKDSIFSDEYLKTTRHIRDKIEELGVEREHEKFESRKNDLTSDSHEAKWVVTGVESNPSYSRFVANLNGIKSVISTICIMLLLIATLVSYTTIGRMVTEQSRLIGTQKAMGLKPWEVYRKYLCYAILSTIFGAVIGLVAAYGFLENLIYYISYNRAYQIDTFKPVFKIAPAIFISFVSMVCASLAAFLASHKVIQRNTISLMSGGTREWKHHNIHGKNLFPITIRMAIRNIIANKKILVTTIVGIAGCTILLISVFTVRVGMSGVTNNQYKKLQNYDGTISLNTEVGIAEINKLEEFISNYSNVESVSVCERYISFLHKGEYDYATLISSYDNSLTDYVKLLDEHTGKPMNVPDDGILISNKCSEEYEYKIGDDFTLLDSNGNPFSVKISGIFQRNIGHAIVISPKLYHQITGEELSMHQFFVRLGDNEKEEFIKQLKTYKAFINFQGTDLYVEAFLYKVSCIDTTILVVLCMIFLLSLFVLLNLAVMNIEQKETEIRVMKVLGLSPWHVRGFVLRESLIMSFFGLIIGLLIGAPMGAYITKSIELQGIQNIRGISIWACMVSITIGIIVFTVTNVLSLFKIHSVSMTQTARQA